MYVCALPSLVCRRHLSDDGRRLFMAHFKRRLSEFTNEQLAWRRMPLPRQRRLLPHWFLTCPLWRNSSTTNVGARLLWKTFYLIFSKFGWPKIGRFLSKIAANCRFDNKQSPGACDKLPVPDVLAPHMLCASTNPERSALRQFYVPPFILLKSLVIHFYLYDKINFESLLLIYFVFSEQKQAGATFANSRCSHSTKLFNRFYI